MNSRRSAAIGHAKQQRSDASEAEYGIRQGVARRLGLDEDGELMSMPDGAATHDMAACDTFGCEVCAAIRDHHLKECTAHGCACARHPRTS